MLVGHAGGIGSLASATVSGSTAAAWTLRRPDMANEADVSLIGFVATQPRKGRTKTGITTLSMRVGWTPRTVDKTTGEWSDQPSSFATLWCYRKVAEYASVCIRRGEPIVVRGRLRVREYTDQNGVRRSSVEITAESIGHDISRGISTYSKLPTRAEPTADEYEQSLAAERNPLPGDREQTAADDVREPGPGSGQESPRLGDADMDQLDPDDGELLVDEEYDEPPAGGVTVNVDDTPGPAGTFG
jgi:single-strand DNA-binding protein